jgi:hypothetical protein
MGDAARSLDVAGPEGGVNKVCRVQMQRNVIFADFLSCNAETQ